MPDDIDDRPFMRTVRVDFRPSGPTIVQADGADDTLRAIAALLKMLRGGDREARVTAYTPGFFETVAAVPGARLVHCPPTDAHPRHVYGAEVELDGVTFEGLYTAKEPK